VTWVEVWGLAMVGLAAAAWWRLDRLGDEPVSPEWRRRHERGEGQL
jgi:hypothetical protein